MPQTEESSFDWRPFIGRSLAFLCLHFAEKRKDGLLDQANFLGTLGLPYRESAPILGTTERSLKELARQRAAKEAKAKQTSEASKLSRG